MFLIVYFLNIHLLILEGERKGEKKRERRGMRNINFNFADSLAYAIIG